MPILGSLLRNTFLQLIFLKPCCNETKLKGQAKTIAIIVSKVISFLLAPIKEITASE